MIDPDFTSRLRDFSCGFFFMFQLLGTAALYAKGRHHQLQRSAFYFMLYLLGISMVEFYLFFIDNFLGAMLKPVTNIMQVTVVPLALMLLYRLTHTHGMKPLAAALNLAPYWVALAVYMTSGSPVVYDSILAAALLHSAGIVIYGFVAVRRFNQQLAACFSTDEHLSLRWTWLLLLFYLALAATWFAATKVDSNVTAAVYNMVCSVIFALLCYFVYRQDDMLEALGRGAGEPSTGTLASKPAGGRQDSYHFAQALHDTFEHGRIYLNPTLNINGLAQELGTNRTYLSNYLNQQLHTSFYEYVNGWRVKHARQLLATTTLPLEDVASQSGFNSLSSFRRYFKKATGTTPACCRAAGVNR